MMWRRGIDHHWRDDTFATAGAAVDVWDHQRSEPVTSLTWGADSMHSVRFNPVSCTASCTAAVSCCGTLNGFDDRWLLTHSASNLHCGLTSMGLVFSRLTLWLGCSNHSTEAALLPLPRPAVGLLMFVCLMQAEPDILVTAGSDRGIALYDLRSGERSQFAYMRLMLEGNTIIIRPLHWATIYFVPDLQCRHILHKLGLHATNVLSA
jgi:hypothetical protein